MANNGEPRVAVLMTGTYREAEFLLQLLPHITGPVEHDVFLVLRHVRCDESSRLGTQERDFSVADVIPLLQPNHYVCELPSIDNQVVSTNYLVPVGPTNEARECGMLSMFHGVFTAISMMESAQRPYTHVMKTRTDYLPWVAPWLTGTLALYEREGRRIIVDGVMTKPTRYPDRPDIPWQGSISDLFCFASAEQFTRLWSFRDILPKIWTGIAETALFRSAMLRFTGDDLQSHRRNEALLRSHFFWEANEGKQSVNMLRAGVLTDVLHGQLIKLVKERLLAIDAAGRLIRSTYDFIADSTDEGRLASEVRAYLPRTLADEYLGLCRDALGRCSPV